MAYAATATIDLSALRLNFAQVQKAAPVSKIMAVIKANGYGHGMIPIASALSNLTNAFAVAQLEEAVKLRERGFPQRIVLLQGFTDKQELLMLSELEVDAVIHQPEQIQILLTNQLPKPIFAWLKLDTGMHRLGFRPHQMMGMYQQLADCKSIAGIPGCLSHFSNADNQSDPKTLAQLKLFQEKTHTLSSAKSIANSAGIIAWPQSHFDWIRPGIMLYGISPLQDKSGKDLGLQPVMTLSTQVIAIQSIKQGEKIGYGETWEAAKDTNIAILGIGYGDGYPRSAQVGTPVLINGKQFPLVGRVSMDSISVNIGEENITVGEFAILWGDGLPVETIAACAATIPYELVCRVSERVCKKIKNDHG